MSGLFSPDALKRRLPELSARYGFDACGVAPAEAPPARLTHLADFIACGHAGDMDWLGETPERRASPRGLWSEAQSVILLGVACADDGDPLADLAHRTKGAIARYAMRRDYHDVIKARLKALARALIAEAGGEAKVFVDTAPVMEKPLAQDAGIGWQGKHTVLISRRHGNWLLLGAIYTTIPLEPDVPARDHCGSCRRCLDICPTNAFPAPYRLDSRRCIAYLTIEHKGPIPRALRPLFGNRIFGCDDCLAICPWNRFATASRDAALALRKDLHLVALREWASLDEPAFRAR
jgi:epoxyqueuosine reductase